MFVSETSVENGRAIINECRGLVLDTHNNFNIVSFPYRRFYNYAEKTAGTRASSPHSVFITRPASVSPAQRFTEFYFFALLYRSEDRLANCASLREARRIDCHSLLVRCCCDLIASVPPLPYRALTRAYVVARRFNGNWEVRSLCEVCKVVVALQWWDAWRSKRGSNRAAIQPSPSRRSSGRVVRRTGRHGTDQQAQRSNENDTAALLYVVFPVFLVCSFLTDWRPSVCVVPLFF